MLPDPIYNSKTTNTDTSQGDRDLPIIKIGSDGTEDSDQESELNFRPPKIYDAFVWPKQTYDDVKQQWVGVVESLGDNEFTVRLQDINNKDAPEEVAIILIDELPDEEKDYLDIGSSFVWTIGRKGDESELFSKIVFRRLPKWSQENIDEAEQWGKEAFEKIRSSDNSATF